MIITRRLFEQAWTAAEAACSFEASPRAYFNQATAHALAFLLARQVKPDTAQVVAEQIAAQLTAAVNWVDVIDDDGALDVLSLGADADAETIKAKYRLLVKALSGKPGGAVMLEKIEAAYAKLKLIGRV